MFTEELVTEMVRLATAGSAGIAVVVLVLVAGALLLVLKRRLEGWTPPAPRPEVPAPPAQWNQDPSQGAVVVPNDDPGGCGDGSKCGG